MVVAAADDDDDNRYPSSPLYGLCIPFGVPQPLVSEAALIHPGNTKVNVVGPSSGPWFQIGQHTGGVSAVFCRAVVSVPEGLSLAWVPWSLKES
ncbi:unnamed protein product [Prunus armeniaca]|uniref:Uncharacterized protein n=1 Tax=Prunus armeniaca TaxID=36596 RepID=A0A6J5TRZ9_PRUAR|nr:unnamed protein product [Prunus armeniaca]